jgi:hypothetical protein
MPFKASVLEGRLLRCKKGKAFSRQLAIAAVIAKTGVNTADAAAKDHSLAPQIPAATPYIMRY